MFKVNSCAHQLEALSDLNSSGQESAEMVLLTQLLAALTAVKGMIMITSF